VINPSGLRPVPAVYYDPATGILWLDNLGLDRVSNTVGGTTIGGDDVGTISLLVTGPPPIAAIAPFTNGNFDLMNFILWSYQYFNGKAQLIGATTPPGQFIRPGVHAIFQYPTGLTYGDFGPIEMAINFTQGSPGAVLNGSLCIPEPSYIGFAPALLGLALSVRLKAGQRPFG
jgi:hypothetical protein